MPAGKAMVQGQEQLLELEAFTQQCPPRGVGRDQTEGHGTCLRGTAIPPGTLATFLYRSQIPLLPSGGLES